MGTTKDSVSHLTKVPLFSGCSKRELQAVARVVREIPHKAGTVIAREGEPGIGLFILVEGTADVTIGGNIRRGLVDLDGRGEVVVTVGEGLTVQLRAAAFGPRRAALQEDALEVGAVVARGREAPALEVGGDVARRDVEPA